VPTDSLLAALNRSTFLYQYETLRGLNQLTAIAASLAILPVALLLLVIVFLVRPIVEKIEQNKYEVLELFLDIPTPLVRVFRAHVYRRVAMHENSEDGAFTDPNVVEEEDEAGVISKVVQDLHDDDAAVLASGQESSSAQRRNRERHAKARAVMLESGFLRRHSTVLKICTFWVLCVIYFAPTYTEFFGNFRSSLLSKPLQVNWASHRTLQTRVVSAHLVEMLTQNYTATYLQGPSLEQNPAMTAARVRDEIAFSYEIITALGMGSEYYGTLAPENAEQSQINFKNACFATPAADCATFADRALTRGIYAAYLDWADKASVALKLVTNAVAESAAAAAAIAATGGLNATALKAAQQAAQFGIINATLNSLPLTQLLKLDYDYLAPATTVATLQYANAPTAMFDAIATSKSVALAIWILLTAGVHFFFFAPLVHKLHDEHCRTTSMVYIQDIERWRFVRFLRFGASVLPGHGLCICISISSLIVLL
jgi:hypothetical protein